MKFFEISDDAGVSFYRWDPEFEIFYFWNEVDRWWETSTFASPDDLKKYIIDVQAFATLREVNEIDIV